MAERLGNVIYWVFSAAAVLWLAFAGPGYYPVDFKLFLLGAIAPSAVLWLTGRATKYVLSGN